MTGIVHLAKIKIKRNFAVMNKDDRQIVMTEDGSHSIYARPFDQIYHSRYGAISESIHVFISSGLEGIMLAHPKQIEILEMGFGTGLNALLTLIAAENYKIQTDYTA